MRPVSQAALTARACALALARSAARGPSRRWSSATAAASSSPASRPTGTPRRRTRSRWMTTRPGDSGGARRRRCGPGARSPCASRSAPGAPLLPIQQTGAGGRLARRRAAGAAGPSPLWPLVGLPRVGGAGRPLPEEPALPSPCTGCPAPCVAACPGQRRWPVASCMSPAAPASAWQERGCQHTCAARLACVPGPEHALSRRPAAVSHGCVAGAPCGAYYAGSPGAAAPARPDRGEQAGQPADGRSGAAPAPAPPGQPARPGPEPAPGPRQGGCPAPALPTGCTKVTARRVRPLAVAARSWNRLWGPPPGPAAGPCRWPAATTPARLEHDLRLAQPGKIGADLHLQPLIAGGQVERAGQLQHQRHGCHHRLSPLRSTIATRGSHRRAVHRNRTRRVGPAARRRGASAGHARGRRADRCRRDRSAAAAPARSARRRAATQHVHPASNAVSVM